MLRVRTYLAPSAIEGIGLFAAEPITRGAIIWKLDPRFDVRVDIRDIAPEDRFVQEWVLRYGYQPTEEPVFVVCGDNARFMNHAEEPNSEDFGDITLARRDIAPGEEITCDYADFDYGFTRHGVAA